MVTETKERARCPHHNYIKVKCLYFLSKCESLVTSGLIARKCNVNPNSLYVLLNRWTKWDLVKRWEGFDEDDGVKRLLYAISPRGRVYLKNLDRWYWYGDKARAEVDYEISRDTWIWGYTTGKYHIIKAPYEDFERDYFTTTERPEVYYQAVRNIDDFFKYAREYLKHPLNKDFESHVRYAVLKAVNEAHDRQSTNENKSK